MDVLHDNSHRTWYQIATQHANLVPAYVLDAAPDKEASAEFPDRQYADTIERLFPLDSPASVWLSAAYFAKNGTAYGSVLRRHVEDQIVKAAAVYGIGNDVAAIMSAIRDTQAEKTAAAQDGDFGYLEKNAAGEIVGRHYPMFDARGVKLASDYFAEHRHLYPLAIRTEIAHNILNKAEQYGVKVADCVRREAGIGLPRRDTVMAEVLERAHMVKDAELAAALANINELVATQDIDELMPELMKMAEIIEAIDQVSGLDRQYGRKVLAPADFLYTIAPKTATTLAEDAVELDRFVFSAAKLAELDSSVFEDALGSEFVGRVSTAGKLDAEKLADELSSLPRPDRRALERHLEATYS